MEQFQQLQISTEIKDIKKLILTSKKDNKELSQAYSNIYRQIESLTIGVKNPETDETKLIIKACEKELKEQEQSKSSGAPYSDQTMILCRIFLENLKPKQLSESEIDYEIVKILETLENKNFGNIISILKQKFPDKLDMKLTTELIKSKLSEYV